MRADDLDITSNGSLHLTAVLLHGSNRLLAGTSHVNTNDRVKRLLSLRVMLGMQSHISEKLHAILDAVDGLGIQEILHGDDTSGIDTTRIDPLLQQP